MSRVAVLLIVIALALPTVAAHVARPWPNIQSSQPFRDVDMAMKGTTADLHMTLKADPARHGVRIVVDPRAQWVAEYRLDPPDPGSAFTTTWNWTRLVEYRDLNANGKYDPGHDTVLRGWRFAAYPWNVTPVTTAFIDNLQVQTVTWNTTVPGGPSFRLQLAVAGRDFTDEGGRARPQDVLLYLDVRDLPPRQTGNLHAIEGTLTFPEGANHGVYKTEGLDSAFMVELPRRQAHAVWGGDAVIDGREQPVGGEMGEPETVDDRWVTPWQLNLPIMERFARFVLTWGIEYQLENKRANPGFVGPLLAIAVALAVGLGGKRSR